MSRNAVLSAKWNAVLSAKWNAVLSAKWKTQGVSYVLGSKSRRFENSLSSIVTTENDTKFGKRMGRAIDAFREMSKVLRDHKISLKRKKCLELLRVMSNFLYGTEF